MRREHEAPTAAIERPPYAFPATPAEQSKKYLTSQARNLAKDRVAESLAVEPITVEPIAVEPITVEPIAVESIAVERVIAVETPRDAAHSRQLANVARGESCPALRALEQKQQLAPPRSHVPAAGK